MSRDLRPLAVARYVWEPGTLGFGLLVLTLIVSAIGDKVIERAVIVALFNTVTVVGLYIFIGNSGVLAFGHLAFAMIGGYATAWFTMSPTKKGFALQLPTFLAETELPMLPAAIISALLAAIVTFIVGIPLMRLGGIAASIGTFAVLMIFYTLYSNWDSWTFGASTLVGIPIYVNLWVALAWAAIALLAATVYQKSRFGLALRATRENEVAAKAVGINVPLQRLIAFVLSGFFVGLGGVLQAHYLGSIVVKAFWLGPTFIALAMLIIGGQRSLTGAVIGVVLVSAVQEVLRQIESIIGLFGLSQLVIALIMLVILIVRPNGIAMGREIPFPSFGSLRRVAAPRGALEPAAAEHAIVPAGGNLDERLEAFDVTVRFGGLAAVDRVTLSVGRREIVGLIGPNGAGKTTIVNVITGFQKPTQGKVVIGGVDVTNLPPHAIGRKGLARTFQAVRLYPDMPVRENLEVAAVGVGLSRVAAGQRAASILDWMEFSHKADARANTLPYGDERRVGIGRALAMAPRYVLLDEPAAGMSDAECDELMRLISRIPQRFGCGVLLIEHNMRVIMGVCDRIHVIDSGRTITEGTPQQIQRDPEVIRAYLGSKSGAAGARGR
ncbi:MAG: branched-chain amino acid ABC transporter ATP-binding protein/permease [Alphaproteobacteria bacterium]|nr:branched-chain amino acid ABC transporter ATP-binding protein/permease [Alphaproteobacteria bacterium]